MKKYTVAIIFNRDFSKVLLVLKNRPEWMKGSYNGPGGKFEKEDKDCFDCVVREVQEESNLVTKRQDWKYCGVLKSHELSIDFLTICYFGFEKDAKALTDESIDWISFENFSGKLTKDLDWIIPHALKLLKEGDFSDTFSKDIQ